MIRGNWTNEIDENYLLRVIRLLIGSHDNLFHVQHSKSLFINFLLTVAFFQWQNNNNEMSQSSTYSRNSIYRTIPTTNHIDNRIICEMVCQSSSYFHYKWVSALNALQQLSTRNINKIWCLCKNIRDEDEREGEQEGERKSEREREKKSARATQWIPRVVDLFLASVRICASVYLFARIFNQSPKLSSEVITLCRLIDYIRRRAHCLAEIGLSLRIFTLFDRSVVMCAMRVSACAYLSVYIYFVSTETIQVIFLSFRR